MSQGAVAAFDARQVERARSSRRFFTQVVPSTIAIAAALALGAVAGIRIVHMVAPAPKVATAPVTPVALEIDAVPEAAIRSTNPFGTLYDDNPYGVLYDPYGTLFDARFAADGSKVSLAQLVTLEVDLGGLPPDPVATADAENPQPASPAPEVAENEPDDAIPVPTPRPSELVAPPSRSPSQLPIRRLAEQTRQTEEIRPTEQTRVPEPTTRRTTTSVQPATASNDNRSFFDKIFSGNQSSKTTNLAYAPANDGLFGNGGLFGNSHSAAPASYDRQTAIYDVSAHTVILPNGRRLEAHSGLGTWMDDPRHANEKNRGATPPNVYELEPREKLFHGVAALRLKPVGNGQTYGRVGLLAHTYMLGPQGQSNGCVSFRDYAAFLQAYQSGEIKRLVVVASQH